ncbi:MAG: sugar phosphate nucleotidyltransferase [Candidatus Parvarchaeota archaeon]|nr:sugar phosphate nucleotidyltransferase [Candidatus Parvarchaeum tengchongense]MCW1299440.1 sugar phosphate nucleotidyltransferase [Candidatus Parvarchaeum tengchongense]
MNGIILAGGTGSRLYPLTKVTNKHLLPVYNKPMVFYPLETLKSLGIKDICIVSGGDHIADFIRLLGSGSEFGVTLTYKVQDGPKGIAHALLQAEKFVKNDEKVAVILGDNIFEKVEAQPEALSDNNAYIYIKEVEDPERFGVVKFNENEISEIIEKPKEPPSKFAVTGLYIYPSDVFDFIKTLKPSQRGELEITDVNNWYLKQGRLKAIKIDGFWSDAGTFESLLKATLFVAERA